MSANIKVVQFPGKSNQPIPVEDMLDACKTLGFSDILIIGMREDDTEAEPIGICLSKSGQLGDALLILKLAERLLLDMAEDELL